MRNDDHQWHSPRFCRCSKSGIYAFFFFLWPLFTSSPVQLQTNFEEGKSWRKWQRISDGSLQQHLLFKAGFRVPPSCPSKVGVSRFAWYQYACWWRSGMCSWTKHFFLHVIPGAIVGTWHAANLRWSQLAIREFRSGSISISLVDGNAMKFPWEPYSYGRPFIQLKISQ